MDDIFPTFIDVRYGWQEAKKSGHSNSNLYIKRAGNKGLGVFANKDFKTGEVIEYCHCLPIETPSAWMWFGDGFYNGWCLPNNKRA